MLRAFSHRIGGSGLHLVLVLAVLVGHCCLFSVPAHAGSHGHDGVALQQVAQDGAASCGASHPTCHHATVQGVEPHPSAAPVLAAPQREPQIFRRDTGPNRAYRAPPPRSIAASLPLLQKYLI